MSDSGLWTFQPSSFRQRMKKRKQVNNFLNSAGCIHVPLPCWRVAGWSCCWSTPQQWAAARPLRIQLAPQHHGHPCGKKIILNKSRETVSLLEECLQQKSCGRKHTVIPLQEKFLYMMNNFGNMKSLLAGEKTMLYKVKKHRHKEQKSHFSSYPEICIWPKQSYIFSAWVENMVVE
jgi:hypothetical protein